MAARFATPDSALRPPYPLDKRRAEEEATLHLKLSIDARGRVVSVEPIGAADPSFLEAARRHILRAWRYKPATEDGVAVPSSTVINLSFRLEDV
jgi:protein TonB